MKAVRLRKRRRTVPIKVARIRRTFLAAPAGASVPHGDTG
jgi:hypothetical protein